MRFITNLSRLIAFLVALPLSSDAAEIGKMEIKVVFLEFKDIGVDLFLQERLVFSGTLTVPEKEASTGFAAMLLANVDRGPLDIRMTTEFETISGEVLVLEDSKILYVQCCGAPNFQISSSDAVLLD